MPCGIGMIYKKALILIFVLSNLSQASADDMAGENQYPQFRNLSGLPGGGFGVTPNGEPSIKGACAISTPVAYSLQPTRVVLGVGNLSDSLALRMFSSAPGDSTFGKSNGTGYIVGGVKTVLGNFSIGGLLLSAIGDSVATAHYQIPLHSNQLALAIGVQDIFGGGGAAGTDMPTDENSSQSLYIVATVNLGDGKFLSFGRGTRRFNGFFANASMNITSKLKASLEHDTYGVNAMLIGEVGNVRGLFHYSGRLYMGLGIVRGHHAFWTLSIGL